MNNTISKPPQSISRRMLVSLIAIVMAMAMTIPATAFAAGAGVAYDSYSVEGYNAGGSYPTENEQHVQLTFTYPGTVVVNQPGTGSSWNDYIAISIAGRDIEDESGGYYRPYTVAANSANSVLIDIGPVMSGGTTAFTAIYDGIITIQTKNLGTLVTSGAVAVDDFTITTVIPTQVHLTNSAATGGIGVATVNQRAVVRGMFHVGIYRQLADGTLEPVWDGDDTSPIGVYTYTCHAHNFTTMTTDALAAEIVSEVQADPAFEAGYTIGSSGSTITVISPDKDELLYVYVFDDNLIQELNALYSLTRDYSWYVAHDGVLPGPLD